VRLLLVTDYYPPLVGGATRAFEQLAGRLAAEGHEVTVVSAWQRQSPTFELRGGIPVIRLRDSVSRIPGTSVDRDRHTPPPLPDPELVWRLRRLLRRTDPDVIYTFGWLTYSLCVALPRRHPPVILSIRDYGNICPKRSLVRNGRQCNGPGWGKCPPCGREIYGPLKTLLGTVGVLGGRRLIARRVSAVQSCSRFAETMVLQNLLAPPAAARLPRYVIPDFRDETGAGVAPPALPSEPFILYVGALRDIKGVRILLDAYERMCAPKPELVLLGARAPETPTTFPPGVSVLPPVPNPDVLAAWDRALFGVAPSLLAEPLGNVIHEAMSRGKAVIGTFPGGHADMIEDGVSGLLVPAGDAAALTRAMERLAFDHDLRNRLGSATRDRAAAFTAERVFPAFAEMFADVSGIRPERIR
jgi:glycosyltransferase involved in cell wall biosynthesis